MIGFGNRAMKGARGVTAPRQRYDRNRALHDVVRDHARTAPDVPAIIFDGRTITYQELDRLSDGLAAELLRHGVRKGDVVGIHMPRSLNTVVAMLASLKAGAAYLPLDRAFPIENIHFMIDECAPRVIFVDSQQGATTLTVDNAGTRVVDIARVNMDRPVAPERGIAVGGGDMAYVMYTSGSTGRPKGAAVPHRGVARLVLEQNFVDFHRGDVVLHAATIAFDASAFEIWGGLLNGATLAILPDTGLSLPRLCDVMQRQQVTIALFTTGLFNLLADYPAPDLPALRHVLFGGEVGSVEHVRRFQAAYPGRRLTNVYGPTEASCMATTYEVPANFDGDELPIGHIIENTGVHILDEDLREVAPGIEGQLAISGDGVAIGYFNRPELTAEKFVTITAEGVATRCYLTGDLAMVDEDGVYWFRGRRDRQIKINGKRIELEEIEAALRRDPRLRDAAVACHAQGSLKRITAYLCPRRPADLSDPEFSRVVMAALRTTLPAYMIPSAAVVLAELPLTPAGKLERAKLLPVPVADARPVVPESRCEEIVTRLWRQVLESDAVSTERNFFDLGGTSLQLLRVHAGLEAELKTSIDVFALFQHPTIRELARFLETRATGDTQEPRRSTGPKRAFSQFVGSGL